MSIWIYKAHTCLAVTVFQRWLNGQNLKQEKCSPSPEYLLLAIPEVPGSAWRVFRVSPGLVASTDIPPIFTTKCCNINLVFIQFFTIQECHIRVFFDSINIPSIILCSYLKGNKDFTQFLQNHKFPIQSLNKSFNKNLFPWWHLEKIFMYENVWLTSGFQ